MPQHTWNTDHTECTFQILHQMELLQCQRDLQSLTETNETQKCFEAFKHMENIVEQPCDTR